VLTYSRLADKLIYNYAYIRHNNDKDLTSVFSSKNDVRNVKYIKVYIHNTHIAPIVGKGNTLKFHYFSGEQHNTYN